MFSRVQKWTKADDESLLTSLRTNVGETGRKDWQRVSDNLSHKFSYKACCRRFERKWLLLSKREDFWQTTKPIQIAVNHRQIHWQPLELSADINKYQVFINEEEKVVPNWTIEEDQLLLEGVKKFGNQWVTICKNQKLYDFFRTPDDCFKRYKYLFRTSDSKVVQS